MTIRVLLESLRPGQWLKNLLAFSGLIFSRQALHPALALNVAGVAACLCLVASAGYLLNDVADRERDRRHPAKARRPVASGALPTGTAAVLALVLGGAGIAGASAIHAGAGWNALGLFVISVFYSAFLKSRFLLDAFGIAGGFLLRAAAGTVVVGVPMSPWLVACTACLALTLAFGKRRQEITVLGEGAPKHRPVLAAYAPVIDHLLTAAAATTLLTYALYTFISDTSRETRGLVWTIPVVGYGVFRYLALAHRPQVPEPGLPAPASAAEAPWRDRPLLATAILWMILVTALVGVGCARAEAAEAGGRKARPYDGNVVRMFERQDPERHPGVRTKYAWRAGAAAVRITPPVGPAYPKVWLAGYGTGRLASAIHDDLYARALVLEIADSPGRAAERRVAIVALDLIGLFYVDTLAIRRHVAAALPSAAGLRVIVACTHVHAGPDTLGLWGPAQIKTGRDPGYVERVRRAAAEAVVRAWKSRRAATLRIAQTRCREYIRDARLPEVIDDRLTVIGADGPDGKAIATLVAWANHPEVLPPQNTILTADYPHYLIGRVEAMRGGVGLFVNGAIGGLMTPLKVPVRNGDGVLMAEGTFEKAEVVGEGVARRALEALAAARPVPARLALATTQVFVPLTNRGFRILSGLGVIQRTVYTDGVVDTGTTTTRYWWKKLPTVVGRDVLTEVGLLEIGPARAALIPGEIYPELVIGGIPMPPAFGADFPDAPIEEPSLEPVVGGRPFFVIGLANDELGYIIPKSEWDQKKPFLYGQRRPPYGEINSAGFDLAPVITRAVRTLSERTRKP